MLKCPKKLNKNVYIDISFKRLCKAFNDIQIKWIRYLCFIQKSTWYKHQVVLSSVSVTCLPNKRRNLQFDLIIIKVALQRLLLQRMYNWPWPPRHSKSVKISTSALFAPKKIAQKTRKPVGYKIRDKTP